MALLPCLNSTPIFIFKLCLTRKHWPSLYSVMTLEWGRGGAGYKHVGSHVVYRFCQSLYRTRLPWLPRRSVAYSLTQ